MRSLVRVLLAVCYLLLLLVRLLALRGVARHATAACCGSLAVREYVPLDSAITERFDPHWLIDTKRLRYNVNRPIGSGGFAQVYKGSYNGSEVAVKVIHAFLLTSAEK